MGLSSNTSYFSRKLAPCTKAATVVASTNHLKLTSLRNEIMRCQWNISIFRTKLAADTENSYLQQSLAPEQRNLTILYTDYKDIYIDEEYRLEELGQLVGIPEFLHDPHGDARQIQEAEHVALQLDLEEHARTHQNSLIQQCTNFGLVDDDSHCESETEYEIHAESDSMELLLSTNGIVAGRLLILESSGNIDDRTRQILGADIPSLDDYYKLVTGAEVEGFWSKKLFGQSLKFSLVNQM
ncbi:hypothetical protein IFR05_003024 [Cadophora sp. M221]|nr:hypothetical protein IFR05_003024 [Cadophora sp. M221]